MFHFNVCEMSTSWPHKSTINTCTSPQLYILLVTVRPLNTKRLVSFELYPPKPTLNHTYSPPILVYRSCLSLFCVNWRFAWKCFLPGFWFILFRLIHADDCRDRTLYPLLVHKHRVMTRKCCVCHLYISRWGSHSDIHNGFGVLDILQIDYFLLNFHQMDHH